MGIILNNINEVERLWKEGDLIKEIAEKLNIKYSTVGYILSAFNLNKKYPRFNSGKFSSLRQYPNRNKLDSKKAKQLSKSYWDNVRSGKIKPKMGKKYGVKNSSWFGKKGNHWMWKGGITSLENSIRNLPESTEWRKRVFIRDKYTCQKCGQVGRHLNSHHIKEFATLMKDFLNKYNQFSPIEDKETLLRLAITHKPFWKIKNGQTLCEDCHKHCFRKKSHGI